MEKLAIVLENWIWKDHLLLKYAIQTQVFLRQTEIVNIISEKPMRYFNNNKKTRD